VNPDAPALRDRAAKDRAAFTEANLGLVRSLVRRYVGRGVEYDDLYQAGCMGLVKAVDGFDASRGLRFSTYAVPVILGEMRRLFRDGGAVKVSRGLKDLGRRAERANAAYQAEHGCQPTISRLAAILGVPVEEAAEAVCAAQHPVSLTVSDDGGDEQFDVSTESFDISLVDILALRQAVCRLCDADREIVRLRYYGGKTQTETASRLGMTQVQVSRREKKIIGTLRGMMAG